MRVDALGRRHPAILGRLGREVEEREPVLAPEPVVESVHLVVDQSVHRVEDQAAHPLPSAVRSRVEVVEHGQEEALGFPRARPRGDNQGGSLPFGPGPCHLDGIALMEVEGSVARDDLWAVKVLAERGIKTARVGEFAERFARG